MPYYVLCHIAQEEDTFTFPCDDLDEALAILLRLAKRGESDRQQTGRQHYFCLTERTGEEETEEQEATVPTAAYGSDTAISLLSSGCDIKEATP